MQGNALRLDEDVDQKLVERVTQSGYAPDLNDEEVERLGCDPFLIAYALGDAAQRAVVTTEVSRPSRKRANRHIPDVCRHLKVDCYNTFQFIKALNFTTGWQRRVPEKLRVALASLGTPCQQIYNRHRGL